MKRAPPPASSPRAAQAARTSDPHELDALCRKFPEADVAIVDAVLRDCGASAAAGDDGESVALASGGALPRAARMVGEKRGRGAAAAEARHARKPK